MFTLPALVLGLLLLAAIQRVARPVLLGQIAGGLVVVGGVALQGGPATRVAWLPELGLALAWVVDPLSATLLVLVGLALAAIATWSATVDQPDLPRLLAGLTTFVAAMVGLLASANLLTLFLFWELTTLCSYALIGFDGTSSKARAAARTSLLVTGSGGLLLLAGSVLVGATAVDLDRLATVVDTTSTPARVGMFLLLAAAMTKSAQLPFHGWLTGAGTAPTAASALLHAATLVVGGVYLVLRVAPVGVEVPGWTATAVLVGLSTYAWCHWGSRRAADAKELLAGTTAAQMGLAFALASLGTPKSTVAAVAVLLVHGAYKSGLFLVVGTTYAATGSKLADDVAPAAATQRALHGALLLGGLSMAGLPPTAGWVAKETGAAAIIGTTGTIAAVLLVVGTALGVAVAVRLVQPFGRKANPTPMTLIAAKATIVPLLVGLLALAAGLWSTGLQSVARVAAAATAGDGAREVVVTAWPSWSTAVAVSLLALTLGVLLAVLDGQRRQARADLVAPRALARGIDATVSAAAELAKRIASLDRPSIVGIVLGASLVAVWPMAYEASSWPQGLPFATSGLQLLAAAALALGTIGLLRTRDRFAAAILLGVVGFSVAGLFMVHGAPDLLLTQVAVETVIVVGFAGVLRRMARTTRRGTDWLAPQTTIRLALAATTGLLVGDLTLSLATSPAATPASDLIVAEAVSTGGGANAVNVVLTDFRALDTAGELIVLFLAAAGSLGIARARRKPARQASASTADGRRLTTATASTATSARRSPKPARRVGTDRDDARAARSRRSRA